MDIKTADRLIELRKAHGFSQEALSEKLGVSRQAISKWERGESSPDTDNLIALSQIYAITLDDILNPSKEIKNPFEPKEEKVNQENKKTSLYKQRGKALFKFPFPIIITAIYIVFNLCLHHWHPSWLIFMLIPIYYHYAGACFTKTKKAYLLALPIPEIIVTIYLMLGFFFSAWGIGAVLFLIIPIYYWIVALYKKK